MKLLAMLIIATGLAVGFAYEPAEYQYTTVERSLAAGQGVDHIAAEYYDQNEDGKCWEEYRYEMRELNRGLSENGRIPQEGDKVIILIAKEVEK